MALFTDGAVTTIEDLTGHDTQLLNVATVEGIDVTRKLALAQEELGVEISGLMGQAMPLGQLSGTPAIGQLVVTPPIKLWHLFRTLEMVYRDAYNSQLNDRYAGKRDEYRDMVKWAYAQVIQSGLGIAADPVPQASTPDVAPAAGGLADGAYYVAVSWMNAAGEEGGSSVPTLIQVSGSSFAVQTTAPANVKGWNVYCGTAPATMTMQNVQGLTPGQTWTQPDTLFTTGGAASAGQSPSYRLAVPRMIQRG